MSYLSSLVDSLPTAFHFPYLKFTLIGLGFLLFSLWFFFRRLRKAFEQLRRKWNPPAPYDPRLLYYYRNAALFWVVWVLLGAALVLVALYLSQYQYLGSKVELAGTATHRGRSIRFTNYDGRESTYSVRGAEVAACGIFLKFPALGHYLGLGTYHKLVTFRGNQENQFHYFKPEADSLSPYADSVYLFLYKHRRGLKIVEPFYTESPYFSGSKHIIFVTHSGYIVQ